MAITWITFRLTNTGFCRSGLWPSEKARSRAAVPARTMLAAIPNLGGFGAHPLDLGGLRRPPRSHAGRRREGARSARASAVLTSVVLAFWPLTSGPLKNARSRAAVPARTMLAAIPNLGGSGAHPLDLGGLRRPPRSHAGRARASAEADGPAGEGARGTRASGPLTSAVLTLWPSRAVVP